jgi:hypothetical protein
MGLTWPNGLTASDAVSPLMADEGDVDLRRRHRHLRHTSGQGGTRTQHVAALRCGGRVSDNSRGNREVSHADARAERPHAVVCTPTQSLYPYEDRASQTIQRLSHNYQSANDLRTRFHGRPAATNVPSRGASWRVGDDRPALATSSAENPDGHLVCR